MDNLEIEKKYLLKNLPNVDFDDVLSISQYYIKRENIWERYRKSVNLKGEVKYYKTIKKKVRMGVSNESEWYITEEDFNEQVSECYKPTSNSKFISKKRYIKYVEDGLKWEIDDFEDIKLIMAEIEIPDIEHFVFIPDWLIGYKIKEVTNHKEFSNRRLAKKI